MTDTPIPLFPDLAYWQTRCYRDNCPNEPTPNPRWLGKYCQPCAARLAADAEAMTTMLTTEGA